MNAVAEPPEWVRVALDGLRERRRMYVLSDSYEVLLAYVTGMEHAARGAFLGVEFQDFVSMRITGSPSSVHRGAQIEQGVRRGASGSDPGRCELDVLAGSALLDLIDAFYGRTAARAVVAARTTSVASQPFPTDHDDVLALTTSSTAARLDDRAAAWAGTGLLVRTLRGAKMTTPGDLFDEVSAALQFPWYFGQNWAAFEECLSEIDWQPVGRGIVLLVRDTSELLGDADDGDLEAFVELCVRVRRAYGTAIDLGESWDRPALTFTLVLQDRAEHLDGVRAAWRAAGAAVADLR